MSTEPTRENDPDWRAVEYIMGRRVEREELTPPEQRDRGGK